MSRQYKQWTPQQRNEGYKNVKVAMAKGIVKKAVACNRCPQTKGIIQLHCEDYDFTIKILPQIIVGNIALDEKMQKEMDTALEPLCWRCHMIHHSEHINKQACDNYWKLVKDGHRFAPVFKHDFGILARENGIYKQKNTANEEQPIAPAERPAPRQESLF